jgi:hypothetical protein
MILPPAGMHIATNLMVILARSQMPEARSQSLATNTRMILPAACTYIATNLMIILARSQMPVARS